MIPPRPYLRKFLFLSLGIILIQIIKLKPEWVENLYSRGVFEYLSIPMRAVLGLIPFSIGDVLYLTVIIWLLWKCIQLFSGALPLKSLWSSVLWNLCFIYLTFNILWGLNYNRNGVEKNLGLDLKEPEQKELIKMADLCIVKVNEYASSGFKGNNFDSLKRISTKAYGSVSKLYPSLQLHYFSIKSSLFGKMGNYLGYSGYYNPFSAEGQLNMYVPAFMLPYVSCHEMAHQLGFAREDEANFIGFLAAREGDPSARYSVYFSSLLYVNRALYQLDSNLAKKNLEKLSPIVKHDIGVYRQYIQDFHTPLETMVDYFYDYYLKWNEQPLGTITYSRVVILMAAYYRKYGDL